MKVNSFERLMVNNPVRQWMVKKNLAKMKSWVPDHEFERILEIGCGFGAGIKAIDSVLSPRFINAVDLDEKMIESARKRCKDIKADLIIDVADAESLPFANNSFDAVIELTIFHHIPNWRNAVAEVARVLKPGGIFLYEDLAREFHFDTPVISFIQQNFTVHPWDSIPTSTEFISQVEAARLSHIRKDRYLFKGWIQGAAKKTID